MALTTEEQELLDFALSALPSWFSDTESRDLAIEAGMAKMAGMARAQASYWFGQTLITTATGPATGTPDWLQQHALDRDTRRTNGEASPGLQERLRQYPDAINRTSILAVAQSIVDAAGVTGDVAMVELRKDRGFLNLNLSQVGRGGVFSSGVGDRMLFTPDEGWLGGRPPFRGPGVEPPIGYTIDIQNSNSITNDGVFEVLAMSGNAVVYENPSGVAEADPGADWQIDRGDRYGNRITSVFAPVGRRGTYLSRGHRMGGRQPLIVLILPFGSSAAVASSVEEAIRQRKAAGIRAVIERRM